MLCVPRTMLFSATLNASVEDLAALALVRSWSDLMVGMVSEDLNNDTVVVTHRVTPHSSHRSAATPQIMKVKPQRIHASPVNAVAQTLEQEIDQRLIWDWSDGPDVNLETGWHQHDNNTSRKKTFGIVCLVLICGQGSINSTQRVEAFELQSQWNFESWTDQNSCGFWVVWFSFWFAAKEFVKAPSAELREAALLSHFESRMMYRKDLYL
jgi:hypothetical protein